LALRGRENWDNSSVTSGGWEESLERLVRRPRAGPQPQALQPVSSGWTSKKTHIEPRAYACGMWWGSPITQHPREQNKKVVPTASLRAPGLTGHFAGTSGA
jgi:hypothetical protein